MTVLTLSPTPFPYQPMPLLQWVLNRSRQAERNMTRLPNNLPSHTALDPLPPTGHLLTEPLICCTWGLRQEHTTEVPYQQVLIPSLEPQ